MPKPPRRLDSLYAMGWLVDPDDNPRIIEHTGILSTFHTDMALLPDEGYGIVLLYNHNHALADYEGIKQGLIDLLVGRHPQSGGPGAGTCGIVLAALMLATTTLQVRSLLRLRKRAPRVREKPSWLLVPRIAWKFFPAALLIGLQALVGFFAGRVFSYWQLFLAMPEVMLWLVLSAVLGTSMGVAQAVVLARPGRVSRSR